MIKISEAKRLIKRCVLANIVSDKKDLAITPLISGKHGIGKSAIVKEVAGELNGVCYTIEGGILKEGEITGLPYQYMNEKGEIRFRFLPYYVVERIQHIEKELYIKKYGKPDDANRFLNENMYSDNDITAENKIEMLKTGAIKPVIVFIDEINRTENTVYKELMNILLTRSVNGYTFPWWVFFVGAMNPSTLNSTYSTNEMDPAQLDRFVKINVSDNATEWLKYAKEKNVEPSIISFIKENPKMLSESSKKLEDEETPEPSPRGWDMIDSLIKSIDPLKGLMSEEENLQKNIDSDIRNLVIAKVGPVVATAYLSSLMTKSKVLLPEEILEDDDQLTKSKPVLENITATKMAQTCNLMIAYLKENIDLIKLNSASFNKLKNKIRILISCCDSSTKLLFAQNMTNTVSEDGEMLIVSMYDVLDEDIKNLLDLSDAIKEKIATIVK